METKQRHGCLTAWLILMIVVNLLVAIVYLFLSNTIAENLPNEIPTSVILIMGVLSLVNLVAAIMLFQWKKWAFWAFAGTTVVAFGINISIGNGIGPSLVGVLGIFILYGVLQIKQGDKTGWSQLE